MRSGSSMTSPVPTSVTPRIWSYVSPASTRQVRRGSRRRFCTFCAFAFVSKAIAPSRNPYHIATEWMLPSGEIVDIAIEWRSCRNASTSSGVILMRSRWFTPWPMAWVIEAPWSDGRARAYVDVSMAGTVRLEIDGTIATITNDNPEKHNAFDDEMDAQLFEILDDLARRSDIRCVIWRGEGKSFSSGRDAGSIGNLKVELSHHELMRRGHRGIQRVWDIDAPVIVACKGWVMGGSFQRALLCDIRVATEGTRFRLPELTYGVIPDTGGVGVLYEMCGHGLVSDLVLTGRVLTAVEALSHGVVSRVVPSDDLDTTVREMAEQIAAAPAVTVKMAREVIKHLALPHVRASMADEVIYQTFINRSDDIAEMRAAHTEDRPPRSQGS